jgi:hypothetical protein
VSVQYNKTKESKRKRFIRIVERRVNNLLHNLDSLGKCSNKKNYDYNDEDIKKIFKAIDNKLNEIKELYKNTNKKKEKFKLN